MGALTALGCSVEAADPSPRLSHRCHHRQHPPPPHHNHHNHNLKVPGTPLFNQSTNSNGLQTSTLPPKPPGSALLQGNRCLQVFKFSRKKTARDANFWLKKNPPENQSLRHNSRPDLTYRAPSPAGSFYQVTST